MLENKTELLCVGIGETSTDDDWPNSIGGQYGEKKTETKTETKKPNKNLLRCALINTWFYWFCIYF